MCLAYDIGNPQFLQIHHCQHRGGKIAADGNHGAVKIARSQRPQHFLVLTVAHHRVGHMVGKLLHQIIPPIHSKHLALLLTQLAGDLRAKPAQADYQIRFHNNSS